MRAKQWLLIVKKEAVSKILNGLVCLKKKHNKFFCLIPSSPYSRNSSL